jgi:hypothetical protein
MDNNNEQPSQITIDSSIQGKTSEIGFDVTSTPSIASIVTREGYTPSASVQAVSDTERRQLIGNISIINQL